MAPPAAHLAQHQKQEPESAGHGDEPARAHDQQAANLSGAPHVLLRRVGLAPEAVGTADGESHYEHRLADAEHGELPPRGAPGALSEWRTVLTAANRVADQIGRCH